MKKLIPIFSEGTVDPDLVEEGRRNLIDFFQSKSYFDAKVAANFQNQGPSADLVYEVNRGSRHKVETVAFRGNQHMDNDALMQQVSVKPHRLLRSRGTFSDKLLHQSLNGITAFYKNRGYEDVKVDSDVVDREPRIYITFQITEGPQTLVDNLTIEGNSHISEKGIRSWNELGRRVKRGEKGIMIFAPMIGYKRNASDGDQSQQTETRKLGINLFWIVSLSVLVLPDLLTKSSISANMGHCFPEREAPQTASHFSC